MRAERSTEAAAGLLSFALILGCGSLAAPGGEEGAIRTPTRGGPARPALALESPPAPESAPGVRPAGVSASLLAEGPLAVALSELLELQAPAAVRPFSGRPDEGIESPRPREEVERQRARALTAPPSPALRSAAPASGAPDPGPSVVAEFDALDVTGCCGGPAEVTPPDPELAVGPSHLVAVVNLALAVYDKGGTALLSNPIPLTALFAGVPGCSSFNFDPNALYDEEADRFVVGADGNFTRYCVAASAGPDPTGAWLRYSFPTDFGGPGFDYPSAGVGREAIFVGANQFTASSGSFIEGRVYAMDKWALYAGKAMAVRTHGLGVDGTTPQPANLHGYLQGTWPTSGPHYVVSDRFLGDRHAVWAWADPFGTDDLTLLGEVDLNVATGVTAGQVLSAPQLGGGAIQGNDWRGLDTEYRNGSLWITHAMSCNPGGGAVDCVRWAEIDPGGPAVVQAGVLASDGEYRLFPDLAVNHCSDMAIGYTLTSTTVFPSVLVTGRRAVDAAGTLRAETLLEAGALNYVAFDGSPYRWGDYTGMTSDPDGLTFWYLGEYSRETGAISKWATRVGAFELPDCPALALAPPRVDLGAVEVGSGSAPVELLLANLGNGASSVSAMTLSNGSDFALDFHGGSTPCGSASPVLAPAAACTVTLTLEPTVQAVFEETLTISVVGAVDGVVGIGGIGYEPCPHPDVVPLSGGPVTGAETVAACLRVETSSYVIGATGEVTATAGEAVVLGEGTVISGTFSAVLDPFLTLP